MKRKPYTSITSNYSWVYLIVLFLSACMMLVSGKIWLGIVGVVLCIVLTIFTVLVETNRKKNLFEYVQQLSFHVHSTSRDSLLKFPMPLTIIDQDGRIIWYNKQCAEIFEDNIFDRNINEVLGTDLDIEQFVNQVQLSARVEYKNRYYNIMANVSDEMPDKTTVILYWVDETEEILIKQEYENSRPVICLLTVDNYEEVRQNTPEIQRPMFAATIEKKIHEWAANNKGIVRKTQQDKYMIMMEKRFLDENVRNKFSFLNDMHAINEGNQMPVTISLGIGVGSDLPDNDSYASSALDMALGRGGDQVVIKDRNKFTYFGGNSAEQETHTRVKTRVMAYALKQLFHQAEKVVLMGHRNADLDAIGAAIGLYSSIQPMDKRVYIVTETQNKSTLKLLERVKRYEEFHDAWLDYEQAKEIVDDDTLLIVVDVYRAPITECPQLLEQAGDIVVLDHHRKSAEFIENTTLVYHEPFASSTCEMVTELLQYIDDGANITPIVAEALYAGIVMDTKNFVFKSGVRTFEAAAYLRRRGVDTLHIKQLFQDDRQVYIQKLAVVKAAFMYREGIAISRLKEKTKDAIMVAAVAADEMLGMEGVSASFVLAEVEDGIHISGRSLGNVNVQVILERIGGGGHITLAAAKVNGNMKQAEEVLKKAIDNYFDDTVEEE